MSLNVGEAAEPKAAHVNLVELGEVRDHIVAAVLAEVEHVLAGATKQEIVARVTSQSVIPAPAIERVIAEVPNNEVVAAVALHYIIVDAAVQAVIAGAAVDAIVAAAAARDRISSLTTVDLVVARTAAQAVIALPSEKGVIARSTTEGVVARTAVNEVVAEARPDGVCTGAALEVIVAGDGTARVPSARDDVVARTTINGRADKVGIITVGALERVRRTFVRWWGNAATLIVAKVDGHECLLLAKHCGNRSASHQARRY